MEPITRFLGGALSTIISGDTLASVAGLPHYSKAFIAGVGILSKPILYNGASSADSFFYTSLGMRTVSNLTISWNAFLDMPNKYPIRNAALAVLTAVAVEEVAALCIPRVIAMSVGDFCAIFVANI